MYVQEPRVINLLAKQVEKGHPPTTLFAKEVEKGHLQGLLSFRFSSLYVEFCKAETQANKLFIL